MPSVIPSWAEKHVGFDYADHGRGKDQVSRYDCWGLVLRIFGMEKGASLPDYSSLYDHSCKDPKVEECFRSGMDDPKVYRRVKDPQPFDIVVFNIAGRPVHCGVMVSATHLLHIHAGTGSCVDAVTSPRWAKRVEGFYRYAGK